jgi:hypothetical protein
MRVMPAVTPHLLTEVFPSFWMMMEDTGGIDEAGVAFAMFFPAIVMVVGILQLVHVIAHWRSPLSCASFIHLRP